MGNGSFLGPGTPGSMGMGSTAAFQNSVANKRLAPIRMNGPPPPRRVASEVLVAGSTGSSVMPRQVAQAQQPSPIMNANNGGLPNLSAGGSSSSSWSNVNGISPEGSSAYTDEPSSFHSGGFAGGSGGALGLKASASTTSLQQGPPSRPISPSAGGNRIPSSGSASAFAGGGSAGGLTMRSRAEGRNKED